MRQDTNFILVHIHRTFFPKYIYTCIGQIRITNPNAEIYLAFYSSCKDIDYERLNAQRCHLIDLRRHCWSIQHFCFKLRNRGIFTTERFFVVYEIMRQYHLSDVIHIENDVMIYADVNKFMAVLRENYELGFVRESDELCIAGFVYIKNFKALKSLCRFFLKIKDINDMTAISLYGHEKNLHYLPVISRNYIQHEKMAYEDNEKKCVQVRKPEIYCENIEKFKSIFDGCAYGQYVGGIDIREKPEDTKGYINKKVCHSVEKCSIVWENSDGLLVPFYVYGGGEIANC